STAWYTLHLVSQCGVSPLPLLPSVSVLFFFVRCALCSQHSPLVVPARLLPQLISLQDALHFLRSELRRTPSAPRHFWVIGTSVGVIVCVLAVAFQIYGNPWVVLVLSLCMLSVLPFITLILYKRREWK